MRKSRYLIFSILLFFMCIMPSFAKEISNGGYTFDIDTDTYPYYALYSDGTCYGVFASTTKFLINSSNYLANEDSSYYKDIYNCSSKQYSSSRKLYSSPSHITSSNHDIFYSSGGIFFEKNIEDETSYQTLSYKINEIKLNFESVPNDTYEKLYDKVKSYIKDNPDQCPYYFIEGVFNLDGKKAIDLYCFKKEELDFYFYTSPSGFTSFHLATSDISHFRFYNSDTSSSPGFSDTYSTYTSFLSLQFPIEESDFTGTLSPDFYVLDPYNQRTNYHYYKTNISKINFVIPELDDNYKDYTFYDKFYYQDELFQVDSFIEIEDGKPLYPTLTYESINTTTDDFNKINSETVKFSWDEFDISKYDYYIAYNDGDFSLTTSNDLTFTFVDNGTVHFKVTLIDSDDILSSYDYEENRIYSYLNDSSIDLDNVFTNTFEDNDFDYTDIPDENNLSVGGFIDYIQSYYSNWTDKKMGVIKQYYKFLSVYKSYSIAGRGENGFIYEHWDSRKTFFSCSYGLSATNLNVLKCMPMDLSSIKLNGKSLFKDEIYAIDFSYFETMVSFLHFLVCLLLGSYTFIKCYRLALAFLDKFQIGGV